MEFLVHNEFSAATVQGTTAEQRLRALRRARNFCMRGSKLFRRLSPEEFREVPKPAERAAVVKAAHERCGHFGRKRTTHLLLLHYWWPGLYNDVKVCITNCQSCNQVQAHFNSMHPTLQSLPVMGMFYRWHVDLAGPFPLSEHGFRYIMVMIEAFSKHVEIVPIPDKTARSTTYAFLHHVLAKFGSCAEVVTDGGGEFLGEFQEMLSDAFIDHRCTSANHPQANGLAERCVQTIKACLRKHMELNAQPQSWDSLVAWIALGYRVTPQAATGLAPYQLLYATSPTIPPAAKARLMPPLDFDKPEAAAQQLLSRAATIQRLCAIAGNNLAIAQHQDTLRYATLRSGGYLPKIKRFEVGDFVYVRHNTSDGKPQTSLSALARKVILRVVEVRDTGILILQGKDGAIISENICNCTPCHLPIHDTVIEHFRPAIDMPCEVCQLPDRPHLMVLCDTCQTGWHTTCLRPVLAKVPRGKTPWFCPRCIEHAPLPQVFIPSAAAPEEPATPRGKGASGQVLPPISKPPKAAPQAPLSREQRAEHRHRTASLVAAIPDADLSSSEGVMAALQKYMPGNWSKGHATRLSQQCPGGSRFLQTPGQQHPGEPQRVVTTEPEIQALLNAVDFSTAAGIADPFAGTGTIASAFRRHGHRVMTNDINPSMPTHTHCNALLHSTYAHLQERSRIHVIVTSPFFAVLDLALPLAILYAHHAVCCHVPGHYVTDGPSPRMEWLRGLQRQERLVVIAGLPVGPMGRRCIWLCIFRTRELRQLMVKPGSAGSIGLHIVEP